MKFHKFNPSAFFKLHYKSSQSIFELIKHDFNSIHLDSIYFQTHFTERDKAPNTLICIENRLRKSVAIFHSLTHAAPSHKYFKLSRVE